SSRHRTVAKTVSLALWFGNAKSGPEGPLFAVDEVERLADDPNVDGLQALGALGHLELDGLVLFQVLVAAALDATEVHEDVVPTFLGDEAVALLRAEPLDGASCHEQSPSFPGLPRGLGRPVRPSGWHAGEGTARSQLLC